MKRTLNLFISGFITLLAISFLTFMLMRLVPGGPFDSEKRLPEEVMAALNAKFKLDLPWWEQYLYYIRDIFFYFDFGPSIKYIGQTVSSIIVESLPVSLELGFYALSLSVIGGVVLGTLAAAFRGTWVDYSSMFLAISGVSLPSFLVATLAIIIFSVHLGVLPATLWDGPEHRILPALVLGIRPTAIIARLTRSSVLEVLYLDYVRTAKAKGLHPNRVLFLHVLRNALVPVITVMGPLSAQILTGSFVVEHIFAVPGLAGHFIQAVSNRDYPLVMGVTLLYAGFLIFINTLVDIVYGIIDPRMRA
jgi:oligopeptide transport system permease protein